jgi:hypothetical protein
MMKNNTADFVRVVEKLSVSNPVLYDQFLRRAYYKQLASSIYLQQVKYYSERKRLKY